jgi:hypothetical protein
MWRRFLTTLQDSKIRFAFKVMPVPIGYKFADENYEFDPPLPIARRRRNVKKPNSPRPKPQAGAPTEKPELIRYTLGWDGR